MFQLFLAFLVVVDLSLPAISSLDVLAFMEYLAQSGMSPDNITNHITAIRSMSIIYGLDTTPFRDQRVPLFVKSLKINRPLAPVVKIVIDHTLLLQIVTVSAHLQFPLVYKSLYLLALFSFLKISNILPHAVKKFDKSRHLCVGDLVFASQRDVIIVKWSKTLQDRVKTTTVDIPFLGSSALCPITALKQMLAKYPSHSDSPLFQIPQAASLTPLTDSAARKHLKHVSSILGLHRSLTFHDFCRGGAPWAWSAHSAHSGPGDLDLQLCLETYCPPFISVTGFCCIYIPLVCLAFSPYLYWVFGPLLSILILHSSHNFYMLILCYDLVTWFDLFTLQLRVHDLLEGP